MKRIWALPVAAILAVLIAGCGDQFKTETKVDNEGTITRTLTFFFAVDADTLEEAKAALNLDRFALPPGGKWEKVEPQMFDEMEMDEDVIDESDEQPTPAPREDQGVDESEVEPTTSESMTMAGPAIASGWQYVVTKTYKPGVPLSDFTYTFPGTKDIPTFTIKNEFQVTTKKRSDGSTEYVFTEKVNGDDLENVMTSVFSDALVQPVLDELGDDATPELAKALKAMVTAGDLEMMGAGASDAPPSGSILKMALAEMFMDTLIDHVGKEKAEAALTRIARRVSRPSYVFALMGEVFKAASKIDDVTFLEISDEITMPGVIETAVGGMQTGDDAVTWTYSPMGAQDAQKAEKEPKVKDLRIVSVAK